MTDCKILLALIAIALANEINCSHQRSLHSWVNPNCTTVCELHNITTVYLRFEGPNDTLHYIWDFTGKPSVLLALTSPAAELNIAWEHFVWGEENSITFSEKPKYTFGLVVQKIYEYDDENDTGLISKVNDSKINVLRTKWFQWEQKAFIQADQFVELSMEARRYENTDDNIRRNGTIKFLLNGFLSLDHSDIMPHILHSENSTQVDLTFDHFQTNSSFSNSRFAVQLLLVSEDGPNTTMSIDAKKTLDDEHTPGIFEIVEIRTPFCDIITQTCDGLGAGGYLQWRPVSYTAASRDVTSSTEMSYYPLSLAKNHVGSAKNSLLYSYYGYRINDLLVQKVNVSLGSKDDGFYKKGNYSTWTFTIGYGTPPTEQFSFLVIMIISIGLGLPLLIIFSAGFYMCTRRVYKRNDGLFLNS